jgi:hypothetical protein
LHPGTLCIVKRSGTCGRFAGSRGRSFPLPCCVATPQIFGGLEELRRFIAGSLLEQDGRPTMHGIIYLIGLIVVIMAILSFFGLR